MQRLTFTLACSFFLMVSAIAQQQVELGQVDWLRDYDRARAQAKAMDRSIFMLFQEVPGCATCQHYGLRVLSHPLIVEAIETLFVPLAVFNNKGGKDRAVLQQFGEPTWNNPVVRLISHQGTDVVPRHNGDYTAYGLVTAMIAALEKSKKVEVPSYLRLVQEELQLEDQNLKEATIGMFCFWTGEKTYGSLAGVAHTEAGFMGGHEVVRVAYDPAQISLMDLLSTGRKHNAADAVFGAEEVEQKALVDGMPEIALREESRYREDHEVHYYLLKSSYRSIPMSRLQSTRVNAALGMGRPVEPYLSPRQLLLKGKEKSLCNNSDWKELLLLESSME
ncbi:MAG: thioredoxin family protein [Saprospiraceae bacterium]|nr:thioredoxin family protein [Saprospiraceae bacterium]